MTMNRAQFLACQQQLKTIATLVRELPLREFIAQAGADDVQAKSIATELLALQASLPPVPANIVR
jgi:hypothetical protein